MEAAGGRRRSHKKLRLVKKKTVRRMLKKLGMKMRGGMSTGASTSVLTPSSLVGGGEVAVTDAAPAEGGRRRKSHRKSHRRSHRVGKFFGF